MDFEWDPDKNESNIKKHGIDFEDVPELFDGPCLEGIDRRFDYGEERVIVFGEIQRRVIAVVYTWREGRRASSVPERRRRRKRRHSPR